MAVDTPARIAIVGAGPVGLEAALYARFLGYDVDVYERGRVAEHLLRQAHVRPFTPWGMNVSALAIAALRTQDEKWQPASADALMTYGELVARYFLPLAQSDLLSDSVQEQNTVVAVGREGLLRGDFAADERRADVMFRLLVRDAEGTERIEHADVVLDCSGTYAVPNYLGCGGMPAVGEVACRDRIEYDVPEVLGADRERYVGRSTLVIGSGHAAATTVTALAALSAADRSTQITWAARREAGGPDGGPIVEVAGDPFPARAELARNANALAAQPSGPVEFLLQTHVEAISFDSATGKSSVEFTGRGAGHREFDRIVANVGHRPDATLYTELQAGEPPDSRDAPDAPLAFAEPDFYVLGQKSFGRAPGFNLAIGREQIRNLFKILGDRDGLDLYRTFPT
jgi:hypothetical protein